MHIRKCVRLDMQNLKILYKTRLSRKNSGSLQPLFHSRKTWIPEKSLQKLEILDMQEKKRREFVKFLH